MSGKAYIVFLMTVVVLGGCKPGLREPLPVCAGKTSTGEALAALELQAAKAEPMRATGKCLPEYYVEDKRKPEKEPIRPLRLYMNPPAEICLHGEIALNSRGMTIS